MIDNLPQPYATKSVQNFSKVIGWKNGKDLNQIKHFVDIVESAVNLKVRYISAGIKESDIIKYDVERT